MYLVPRPSKNKLSRLCYQAPLQIWLCRKWWNMLGWTLLERKHLNFLLTEILCAINLEVKAVSSLGPCTLQNEIMAKKALCLDTNWMRHQVTPRMTTIGHMVAYQISSTHWKDLRSVWEWRCTPGRKSKQFIGKETFFQLIRIIFAVSSRKLVIAVPRFPLEEISGDVAADIKRNVFFEAIFAKSGFKAVAVYSYPWWENITSLYNQTLKPFERFFSAASCLVSIMPYR